MKFKKVCMISAVCLLLLASMAVINPDGITIGDIINHPWTALRCLF